MPKIRNADRLIRLEVGSRVSVAVAVAGSRRVCNQPLV